MQMLPREIHKGMRVFDNEHHEIGVVEDFRFGEDGDDPQIDAVEGERFERRDTSLMDDIADAFAPDSGVPDVLRDRMLAEGYIRLDSRGMFAADRYILPEQIASAAGDELTLAVSKDELLKH